MGQAKSSQRPGSGKPLQVFTQTSLVCKTGQKSPVKPLFCLEIPCPASLSPQMDICASLAAICIAGTPRKLKQDQSSLVLGVVKTKTVQKEKTKRRESWEKVPSLLALDPPPSPFHQEASAKRVWGKHKRNSSLERAGNMLCLGSHSCSAIEDQKPNWTAHSQTSSVPWDIKVCLHSCLLALLNALPKLHQAKAPAAPAGEPR